jgi:hypothetical protein
MDWNLIVSEVLPMGLPGVVIIVLAYAYHSKDKKVDELNEKRIAEGRETIKSIEQNTAALDALTDVIKERRVG